MQAIYLVKVSKFDDKQHTNTHTHTHTHLTYTWRTRAMRMWASDEVWSTARQRCISPVAASMSPAHIIRTLNSIVAVPSFISIYGLIFTICRCKWYCLGLSAANIPSCQGALWTRQTIWQTSRRANLNSMARWPFVRLGRESSAH